MSRFLPRRPQGQITRGKTAIGRLRHVDVATLLYDPSVLTRRENEWQSALVVDLGYGSEPCTTVAMTRLFRSLNPELHFLGVEIDPERVRAALPFREPHLQFRLGGFNLPLLKDTGGKPETVRMIRAFNVLRQYEEPAVADAWAMMGSALLPGGLLIEGTSNPNGHLWVANVIRRQDDGTLLPEALLLGVRRIGHFLPIQLQPVLPKNFIHRMVPGEPIHDFFTSWKMTTQHTAHIQIWGQRRWFQSSLCLLAEEGWPVDTRRCWVRRGIILVRLNKGNLQKRNNPHHRFQDGSS